MIVSFKLIAAEVVLGICAVSMSGVMAQQPHSAFRKGRNHKSIRLIVTVVLIMLLVTYCISGAVNSTQEQIRTYVANDCNGMVSVIDSTSNTVVNTISVGISPIEIAITPDGTRAVRQYVNEHSHN